MRRDWLEIPDPRLDAAEVMERVQERMAIRNSVSLPEGVANDPCVLADVLWGRLIDSETEDGAPIREQDCDIVPRNYVIDWRIPILGPIHALIRRIINAEIRRYVSSSLEKQSYLNRQMLRLLNDLVEENKRLRREIEELREGDG